MATYEVAAAAGQAMLTDIRRNSDDSCLLPAQVVPFFTEHSERATAPSILATVGIPKSERDLLGRWCPEGSDTYMRTYKTVVAKLQHRMAEALRSPTRYKDLEEFEIIPELVIWLRERAGMTLLDAESMAETFATIMKTSSFDDSWILEAPTQTLLSPVGADNLPAEEASDTESLTGSHGLENRDDGKYILVFAAGKRGATLHNTSNCWMAKSRSFSSVEIRESKPNPNEYHASANYVGPLKSLCKNRSRVQVHLNQRPCKWKTHNWM